MVLKRRDGLLAGQDQVLVEEGLHAQGQAQEVELDGPVVAVEGGRVEGEGGAAGIEAEGQGRGRQAEVGVITLGAKSRVWAVPPPEPRTVAV